MKPKKVPCMVNNPEGKQIVELIKGPEESLFGHPDWRCTNIDCPKFQKNRQDGGGPEVRLGGTGSMHGVVNCASDGRAERK